MKLLAGFSLLFATTSVFAQIKVNSITATYNGGSTWPSGTYNVSQSTRASYGYAFSAPVIGSNPEAMLSYWATAMGSKGQSITNYNTSVDADPVSLTYTVEYTGAGVPTSTGGTASYSIGRYTRLYRYVHFNILVAGASGSANVGTNVTYLGTTYDYPNLAALSESSGGAIWEFDEYFPGSTPSTWKTDVDPLTGTTTGFHLDPDGKYRATIVTSPTLNSTDLDCWSSLTVNGASGGGVSVISGATADWRLRLDSFAGYTP